MARIPISQVPNAPLWMQDPAMIQTPQGSYNLGAASAQLQVAELDQGAYNMAARGARALGQAAQEAGGVFSELSRKMAASKNYADLARADAIMTATQEKFAQDTAAVDPAERLNLWTTKYRPQAEQQFSDLGLTPWAKDRIGPDWIKFDGRTQTGIAYAAHQAQIESDRQALLGQVQSRVQAGDLEGAQKGIDNMVAAHQLTPERAQTMAAGIRGQDETNRLMGRIAQDPRGALSALEETKASGRSADYGILDERPDVINYYTGLARNAVMKNEVEAGYAVHQAILGGQVLSEDQIKAQTGTALTDGQVKRLAALSLSDPAYDANALTKLRTAVRGYSAKDPAAFQNYEQLNSQIANSVPKAQQGPLLDELHSVWQKRSDPSVDAVRPVQARAFAQVDRYAEQGFFGASGADQAQVAGGKAELVKASMGKYFEQNPNTSDAQINARLWETVKANGAMSKVAGTMRQSVLGAVIGGN